MQLTSLDDMWRLAQYTVASGLAPKSFAKAEQVLIAIQMGAEVGLSPMQSLQNIAVINGRPSLWGDAVGGLIRRSQFCKSLKQPEFQGNGETRVCIVRAERVNGDTAEGRFGYADAKRAKLLTRDTYQNYPDRMFYHRALGYVAHELFPDVLMGMNMVEEIQDVQYSEGEKPLVSGDDAPLASLDDAANLIDQDDASVTEAEFTPYHGPASQMTPEEMADYQREQAEERRVHGDQLFPRRHSFLTTHRTNDASQPPANAFAYCKAEA